jgi:serine/threonine protein kinase
VGTIFYMAPEVLLLASYKGSALEAAVSKRVGEKMDVWSLGVCLFELAAGTASQEQHAKQRLVTLFTSMYFPPNRSAQ